MHENRSRQTVRAHLKEDHDEQIRRITIKLS